MSMTLSTTKNFITSINFKKLIEQNNQYTTQNTGLIKIHKLHLKHFFSVIKI